MCNLHRSDRDNYIYIYNYISLYIHSPVTQRLKDMETSKNSLALFISCMVTHFTLLFKYNKQSLSCIGFSFTPIKQHTHTPTCLAFLASLNVNTKQCITIRSCIAVTLAARGEIHLSHWILWARRLINKDILVPTFRFNYQISDKEIELKSQRLFHNK